MSNFKWSDACLIPNSQAVKFPDPDNRAKKIAVTFSEFPRETFLDFIREASSLSMLQMVDNPGFDPDSPEGPENPAQIPVQTPIVEVEQNRFEMLTRYLSLACGGTQTPEFFASLGLPVAAYGKLCGLLFELNEVDAIVRAQGNYLALPGLLQEAAPTNPPEGTGQE